MHYVELALNLLWLLTGAVALWRWSVCCRGRSRRQSFVGLAALSCALVLFFPIISASDDLHAATPAVEDYSLSARKVRGAVHRISSHVLYAVPVRSLITMPEAGCEGTITPAFVRISAATHAASLTSRAPPSFLFS